MTSSYDKGGNEKDDYIGYQPEMVPYTNQNT